MKFTGFILLLPSVDTISALVAQKRNHFEGASKFQGLQPFASGIITRSPCFLPGLHESLGPPPLFFFKDARFDMKDGSRNQAPWSAVHCNKMENPALGVTFP